MIPNHGFGIALSLGTCFLWSLAPFFFVSPGRRIGPFATNLARLLMASVMLAALCVVYWISRPGVPFPGMGACALLALSGISGLALGDHFFYRSLSELGPERTSLLMTLSPVITACLAWIFLGEKLSSEQLLGMALVLGGVVAATWPKKLPGEKGANWGTAWNGIVSALILGVSTVLAREAFLRSAELSPLYATAIRIGSGALALMLIALASGSFKPALKKASDPGIAIRLLAGTLLGPVVGMLCYIAALKYQSAGVVTTITFMTPLLIIPLGAWKYGVRLGRRVLFSGLAALAGVALLGWNP